MNDVMKRTLSLIVVLLMVATVPPVAALSFMGQGPVDMALGPATTTRPLDPRAATYPSEVNTTTVENATYLNTQRNIVRDDTGRVHVVYSSSGEIWYSTSTNNGQTWNNAINVSNDTSWYSVTPSIATNGSTIYIAWSDITAAGGDNEQVSFRKTTNNGTTWSPAKDQPPYVLYSWTPRPFTPAIAANHDGDDVYVIWTSNENNGEGRPEDVIWMRRSIDNGDNFILPPTAVSNTQFMAYRGTIECDGDRVVVSWHGGTTNGNSDNEIWWRSSQNNAQNWLAGPQRFTYNMREDINPTIALNNTNISIFWQYHGGTYWELAYKNSTNLGQTWIQGTNSDPEYLHPRQADMVTPTAAIDGDEVYVMWVDNGGNARGDLILTYMNTTTNWTMPQRVTSDPTGARYPSLKHNVSDGVIEWVWMNETSSPYSVLYNLINLEGQPTVDWTGEAGYVSDGVEPDVGTTGHVYTFRIDYSDPDDDAPDTGYPMIQVDTNIDGFFQPNEVFEMVEENVTDTTYTDGKIYTYTPTFSGEGLSKYFVTAWDESRAKARGPATAVTDGPDITSVNYAPKLYWVETPGYVDDGLEPENGPASTDFVFKIEYLDIGNEAPAAGFPKVYFDLDGDGDFYGASDENETMLESVPGDTTFDNGKVYYYNRTFDQPDVGTEYHYMFFVEDLVGLTNQTPSRTGPSIEAMGEPPVLSETGESGYGSDGVEPDSGSDTTEFTFRVKFTDPDGDLPKTDYPRVGIDLDMEGNITAVEKFVMDEVDPGDTDTTDGKLYAYSYVFNKLGSFSYLFEAVDTNGSPSNILTYDGPVVDTTNPPPKLSYVGSEGYVSDGLQPEDGVAGQTDFVYQVLYSDLADEAPLTGHPMIWIDIDLDGNENASEWFEMEESDPANTDYMNGKRYGYITKLDLAGNYTYQFTAKDESGALATGSPTEGDTGPNVAAPPNLPPVLEFLGVGDFNDSGVSPLVGEFDTEFTYKVMYTDLEGDLPGADWPRLYIDAENDGDYAGTNDMVVVMEEVDVNDTAVDDGKVYLFTTTLPIAGTDYTYKFKAEDINDVVASGTGSIFDQVYNAPDVIINLDPILKFTGAVGYLNDGVAPDSAQKGSTFTFKVSYTDPEGDPPLDGNVYLRIDADRNGAIDVTDPKLTMSAVDTADTNYTDGKEYTIDHTFADPGTYGYRFEALDIFNNMAGGPAGADYLVGPIVTEILPNQVPVLVFTGEANYENDGVHPLSGKKDTTFTFRVKYIDVDNDAPKDGFPKLVIGGSEHTMVGSDAGDTNYADGKVYQVDINLEKKDTYTYTFRAENTINQTATLGPMEGPVVLEDIKDIEPTESMLSDMFWLIILIIIAIVALVIGLVAGSKRKRPAEPEYQPRYPPEEQVDMTQEEVPEEPPQIEPGPQAEEPPYYEPPPAAEAPPEGGAAADLEAGAEQPPETVEDAQAPAQESPEAPTEEHKTDLSARTDETEAPAGETEAGAEKVEDEKVDDEIDSILSKLEND